MKKRNILKCLAVGMAACAMVACTSENATARDEGSAPATSTSADGTAASPKARLNPYDGETEIKIAYIAHDISTPNN